MRRPPSPLLILLAAACLLAGRPARGQPAGRARAVGAPTCRRGSARRDRAAARAHAHPLREPVRQQRRAGVHRRRSRLLPASGHRPGARALRQLVRDHPGPGHGAGGRGVVGDQSRPLERDRPRHSAEDGAGQGHLPPGWGDQALVIRKAVYDAGRGHTLDDLRGLNVAMTPPGRGTASGCALGAGLQRVGLTLDALEISAINFPEMLAALANGAIDGAMLQRAVPGPRAAPGHDRAHGRAGRDVSELHHQLGDLHAAALRRPARGQGVRPRFHPRRARLPGRARGGTRRV